MVVITINRDQLRGITVETRAIEQQLNVITVVCVHIGDDRARLTVGLEEAALADVRDGVTNFGSGNVVECAITVNGNGLARGTARLRRVVTRETERLRSTVARGAVGHRSPWHRSAWHRSVAPGCGKGKFDAQVL
jgi:hypothetical protein